jgi:HAD superfamily hydrolase (TIGR01509 family)
LNRLQGRIVVQPIEVLRGRDRWIFDLDGTLTLAAHDFDAIRDALGLPKGRPILEEIAARQPDEARALESELDAIELEIARRSRAQPGAHELLGALRAAGHRTAILTRNSERNAFATLSACGLEEFFEPTHVIGRESSLPKPKPDGIALLLARWGVAAERGLIVGDFRYDLEAGRAAGVATVYFDVLGTREWEAYSDHRVEHLDELRSAVPSP